MKRSIFAAVLGVVMVGAASSYGQGQINFSNYYAYGQTTGVKYGNGPDVGLFAGSEMTATLLWGASTDTLISQLTAAAGSATALGYPSTPGASTTTGAGLIAGPTLNLGVGNFAYAISVDGFLSGIEYTGVSSIFVGPTSTSSLLPPANLPTGLEQATILINSVPEPTTMALGGLGLAALLIARRKKV